MRFYVPLILALLLSSPIYAKGGAPQSEPGWSGFVLAGGRYIDYQSNFFAGHDSQTQISDFSAAPRQNGFGPQFNFDLRYTLAQSQTQFFLGNLIQDAVRFDFTQHVGVRQPIASKGTLAASFIFNAMPLEQWQDPFALNVDRQSTDVTSRGGRLAWDGIWGSGFNASMTTRKVKVEQERSAVQFDSEHLTQYAQKLDRNGNIHTLNLSYKLPIVKGQTFETGLLYRRGDLKGAAHSYQSYGLLLTHSLRNPQWSLISNVYVGQSDYDEANPLFGLNADCDEFAFTSTFMWHRLFNLTPLSASFSAGYAKANSLISFYDSQSLLFSAGLLYNF